MSETNVNIPLPAPTITKAVILAAGMGKRMQAEDASAQLNPEQARVAQAGVKGMIDVGRPFLDYAISALADAGITRVCLVIGPHHDIIRERYSNPNLTSRISIDFAVQKEPLGTANAVAAAREFVGTDPFVVVNSDNYYPPAALQNLTRVKGAATLGFDRTALVEHSNIPAERIAAFAILTGTGTNLVDIVEKPTPEQLCKYPEARISMNAWAFPSQIFDVISQLSPSPRGEYELPDAVRTLIQQGVEVAVIACATGVLDLSSRGDIQAVKTALQAVTVTL